MIGGFPASTIPAAHDMSGQPANTPRAQDGQQAGFRAISPHELALAILFCPDALTMGVHFS